MKVNFSLNFFYFIFFALENKIYTVFNIGVEADENKHKVVTAKDNTPKSDKFYYPSKNKKYEADEVVNDNIAEKTSTRLDGKVEGNCFFLLFYFFTFFVIIFLILFILFIS